MAKKTQVKIDPKLNWPADVPVLEGKDFTRFTLNDGKGHHCMLGWIEHAFGSAAGGNYQTVSTVQQLAVEVAREKKLVHSKSGDIASVNDSTSNSKEALADWWNSTIKKLGYTHIMDA